MCVGEYEDRRHRTKVDCSQTIWVLATNAIDEPIMAFCEKHKTSLLNGQDHTDRPMLVKKLAKVIKKAFKEQFKVRPPLPEDGVHPLTGCFVQPPLTGRISAFIPFVPFSPGEQAVGAHKFLLEFAREVRRPVQLQPGQNAQLMGNIQLHLRQDASVCRFIAEDGYDQDLGIRSLISAVRDTVELSLFESYVGVDQPIEESEEMVDYRVEVRNDELVVTMAAKDRAKEGETSICW